MGNLSINNGGIRANKEGMPSIDLRYGPYESVSAAHAALSDYGLCAVGLTVGIISGSSITEYWYQGGTSESNLVKKQSDVTVDAYTKTESDEKYQPKGNYQPAGDYATKTELNGKVDNVPGKGLSTNDYTNEEKQKVADALVPADIAGKANASDVYAKTETYNKTELDNMITTPDQEYVTVTATAQTTAVTDLLPATGAADTVYRVGCWDGTQYDDTVYSEYAWNGTSYVKLHTKNVGIDDEPTLGSNNLVKSGGVYKQFCSKYDAEYIPTTSQIRPLIGRVLRAGVTYQINVSWDIKQGVFAHLSASNTNGGEPKDVVIPSIYSQRGSRTVEYTPSVDVSYWYISMGTGYVFEDGTKINIEIEEHHTIEEIIAITNSLERDVQSLKYDFDNGNYPDNSISHEKLQNNAVESNNIKDGSIDKIEKLGGPVKNVTQSASENIGYKVEVDNVGTYKFLDTEFAYPIHVGTVITNNGVKVAFASDAQLTTRKDLNNGETWVTTFEINHVRTLNTEGNVRIVVDNRNHLCDGITVDSSNIKDGSIGAEKLSITEHGTNIYDHENDTDFAENKYLGSNTGRLDDNNNYDTSGFIPVKPLTSYSSVNTSTYRFVLQFNALKQAITSTYESGDIKTFTTNENAAFVKVTFYKNRPLFMCEGSERKPYEEYRIFISPDYLPSDTDNKDYSDIFFLPKHIYVAAGRTIEIYYNQIMLNAEKYNIKATCGIGKALDRKFQIIGNSSKIGNTYTLSVEVYDDFDHVVVSGTSTIHIVADTISSAKNVLPVGDSLTNGKAWLTELHNLSSNITTVGTRQSSHEGRSGADVNTYTDITGRIIYSYDNQYRGVGYGTAPTFDNTLRYNIGDKVKIAHTFGNGTQGYRYWVFTANHTPGAFDETEAYCFSDGNPFYDYVNDKFSMGFYRTFQSINYDAIILYLGTNGINLTPETNPNGALGIKNLIELIREDEPTIPIIVVNTIFRSSQNGIGNQGNTDGYTAQSAYKFNEDKKVILLAQAIDKLCGSMSKVYLCPVGFTHDSKYNYGNAKVAVNPRLTNTDDVYELQPSDSIHPQNSGYMQMADEIFSTLCAVFNE